MLDINMADVMNVLNNISGYLIAMAIILIVAIIVCVCCRNMDKARKFMVRSQTWIVAVLAVVIIVNLIIAGPMSTLVSLTMSGSGGDGTISEETTAKATDLVEEITGEGIVMLENDDQSLPVSGTAVNVFGWASTNPCYGGTGSGSISENYELVSLLDGLEDAGLSVNEELVDFYTSYQSERPEIGMFTQDWTLPEPNVSEYSDELINNAKEFSDTAIVVLTRIGGEGADLPTDMIGLEDGTFDENMTYDDSMNEGNDWDEGDTYLNISNREEELIAMVCENFDNVILVYNGANTMELGFVNDYEQLRSVLWCPGTGQNGFDALGKIITGEINPSGKTADTFVYDLKETPYFNNIGNFKYDNMDEFESYCDSYDEYTVPSFVDYVEGIYVGYKFYETAAEEGAIDYDAVVQYPFGYGLSYTTFTQELTDASASDGTITLNVTVTNTGDVAGKDVVEVYYNPPYTNGGIEKASANLAAFAKTDLLEPGSSQELTLSFNAEDMASYDEYNAKCYVLEAGDYTISINTDSHNVIDTYVYTVDSTITYDESNPRSTDETAAVNQFDYVSGEISTYLSRADGFANYDEATAAPTNYSMSEEAKAGFVYTDNYDPTTDDDPDAEMPTTGANNGLTLAEFRGLAYDDEKWDDLLDQMTVDEMNDLIGYAGYTTGAVSSVGKVQTIDCDGPASLNNNFTGEASVGFPSTIVLACTWNVELGKEFGEMIGEMAEEMDISGWYAPAMNMHRSAFDGRNFEYYSEDPNLSGYITANVIQGAKDHGVYSYIKHFAMNDQQKNQVYMLCTWANEQSMREIYLRPFELAVKEGGAQAAMAAHCYIGNKWCAGSSSLLDNVLRDEWGFDGFVETDFCGFTYYYNADQAVRNGTDAILANYDAGTNTVKDLTASAVEDMREASHRILYVTVNSRAYENEASTGMASWQIMMIVIDVIVVILALVCEYLVYRGYKKRK